MINNEILPLNYIIIYSSSTDPLFPIENIKKSYNIISNNNKFKDKINIGWSSMRFCSYPQIIIIQLTKICDVTQINFLINHERIPTQIEIYSFSPKNFVDTTISDKYIINKPFNFIGNVYPTNHQSNNRELKKVLLNEFHISNCLYLKFVFHINYPDPIRNKYNQIGIVQIEIFGIDNNTPLPLINRKNYFKEEETDITEIKGLLQDDDYVDFIKDKIEFAKRLYYKEKNELIYNDIEQLRELGRKVRGLLEEKKMYQILKDNLNYKKLRNEIDNIQNYVDENYRDYGGEQIIYENKNPIDVTKQSYINYLMINSNNLQNDYNNSNYNYPINDNTQINDFIQKNDDYDYQKTKEVLERRKQKQLLIQQSLEEARNNIKAQNLALHNVNVNL